MCMKCFLFYVFEYLCIYMYVYHEPVVPTEDRRGCEPPCQYWELNLGLLQEKKKKNRALNHSPISPATARGLSKLEKERFHLKKNPLHAVVGCI